MTKLRNVFFAALFVCVAFLTAPVHADEGMWLFENPPTEQVKDTYSFELTEGWLEHVRLSSCRFARRGSASFISDQGLILTNHHVGARNLHELSTPENNLLEKGFYAKNLDDELKCQGLEVFVLDKIENVTEKIADATKDAASPEEAAKLRGAFIAKLEQETADKTGLRCEVITLYQGGAYHLYGYKIYDDIRLVWAPEEKIASFGGDPDNYEYPRYCLDASMFRAYEDGKPAKIKHYLKWGTGGVKDGELVFVSGHPGTTNRAYTKEHLEYMRDVYFPWRLQKLFRREAIYAAFGNRSLENQRRIAGDLGGVQNYRKRAMGQLDGLQTPSLWNGKLSTGDEGASDAVETIADACESISDSVPSTGLSNYVVYDLLEGGEAFNCRTFQIARTLVRLAQESEKPNEERLREYREGGLTALKASLLNDAPIYDDVEILKLIDSLTMLHEAGQGAIWKALIENDILPGDVSPKEVAQLLIMGSTVRDIVERKRLIDGGLEAIEDSDDPMIQFALSIDEIAREVRKTFDETFTTPTTTAYAELAERRFEELGTGVYPDATLTLRLSYGAVKGYAEDNGTEIEPVTNIAGMYARAEALQHKEPFDPPQSWKDKQTELNPNCAFNLVSTNDIIGGNSGSPLINAKAEVVGLVFDGNIYSLSNNFVYTEEQSRCVSVHADVILESLKKVYKAERIVKELGQ